MSNPDEYTEDVDIDLSPVLEPGKKGKPRPVVDVTQWIRTQTGEKRQTAQFKRVVAGSQKYPHASLYELQHGMNSKASKEYRARQAEPVSIGEADYKDLAQSLTDAGLVVIGRGDYDQEHYASLILARDHKKLFAYGGLIRYDPGRDESKPQSELSRYVIGEIKRRLHEP